MRGLVFAILAGSALMSQTIANLKRHHDADDEGGMLMMRVVFMVCGALALIYGFVGD